MKKLKSIISLGFICALGCGSIIEATAKVIPHDRATIRYRKAPIRSHELSTKKQKQASEELKASQISKYIEDDQEPKPKTEVQVKRFKADDLNMNALTIRDEKDFQQAIKLHQEALEIYESISDYKGRASSHLYLGQAFESLEQYNLAIEHFEESQAVYQKLGDKYGRSAAYNGLARIYSLTDKNFRDLNQALAAAKNSNELSSQLLDSYGEGVALMLLGDISIERQEATEALDYYKRSRGFFANLGIEDKLAEVESKIKKLEN